MKYENRENAKARVLYNRKLIDLYLSSDSFEQFKSAAAQLHGYNCHFFDPFWRAYWSRRHPAAYQCMLGSVIAAFSISACVALHILVGCCVVYALIPIFGLIPIVAFDCIGSDIMNVIDCHE